MKKRVLAGLLWFYVTWCAWSFLAAFAGLPQLAGPVVGAAVAMFIAGDPLGRIWGGRSIEQFHDAGHRTAVRARLTLSASERPQRTSTA